MRDLVVCELSELREMMLEVSRELREMMLEVSREVHAENHFQWVKANERMPERRGPHQKVLMRFCGRNHEVRSIGYLEKQMKTSDGEFADSYEWTEIPQ